MKGFENLYLSDLDHDDFNSLMSYGLCVKSCPSQEQASDPEWWKSNCKSNSVTKCESMAVKGNEANQYGTTLTRRVCYPDSSKTDRPTSLYQIDALKNSLKSSEAGKFIFSIWKSWGSIIILFFTGILFALSYLYFVSKYTREVAIATMGIIVTVLIGGGAAALIIAPNRPDNQQTPTTVMGIIMILVGLIVICQIWCYRKSLETAIAIVDASANFFIDTKRIIGVSMTYFALSLITFLCWVVMELFLVSLMDFRKSGGP